MDDLDVIAFRQRFLNLLASRHDLAVDLDRHSALRVTDLCQQHGQRAADGALVGLAIEDDLHRSILVRCTRNTHAKFPRLSARQGAVAGLAPESSGNRQRVRKGHHTSDATDTGRAEGGTVDAIQSVTLTGRMLEGVAAETAWPRIAALLRMSAADFSTRVQPRLPLTLKATTTESAQRQEQTLRRIGVEAIALPADGPSALLRDGKALRGPVSRAWLQHALETGSIQPGAEVHSNDATEWERADVWLATRENPSDLEDAPRNSVPEPLPRAEPASTEFAPSASTALPPFSAPSPSSAGFWRRLAARLTRAR